MLQYAITFLIIALVAAVFGFPKPVIQAEVAEQRSINLNLFAALDLQPEFRDEFPIKLAGAVFEQFLEGGADGGFVGDTQFVKFGQRVVISDYGLVRGLESQARHGLFVSGKTTRGKYIPVFDAFCGGCHCGCHCGLTRSWIGASCRHHHE